MGVRRKRNRGEEGKLPNEGRLTFTIEGEPQMSKKMPRGLRMRYKVARNVEQAICPRYRTDSGQVKRRGRKSTAMA